jgi:hypothetical protein
LGDAIPQKYPFFFFFRGFAAQKEEKNQVGDCPFGVGFVIFSATPKKSQTPPEWSGTLRVHVLPICTRSVQDGAPHFWCVLAAKPPKHTRKTIRFPRVSPEFCYYYICKFCSPMLQSLAK